MAITQAIAFKGKYVNIADKLWQDNQTTANHQKTKYFDRLLDVWLVAGIVGYLVKENNLNFVPSATMATGAKDKRINIDTINKNFTEINHYLQLLALNTAKNLENEDELKFIFLNQDSVTQVDYDQRRVDYYQQYVEVGLDYIDSKWLQSESPESVLRNIEQFVETYNQHEIQIDDEYELDVDTMMGVLWDE